MAYLVPRRQQTARRTGSRPCSQLDSALLCILNNPRRLMEMIMTDIRSGSIRGE